jgi:hypothetical protein
MDTQAATPGSPLSEVNSPPMPSLVSLIEISTLEVAAVGHHAAVRTAAEQAERPSRLQVHTMCGRRSYQTYLASHDKELDGWSPEVQVHPSVKCHQTNQLFKELQVNFSNFLLVFA